MLNIFDLAIITESRTQRAEHREQTQRAEHREQRAEQREQNKESSSCR
jgi:hypothetical protein